ncbi:hypothetical protein PHET_07616, partial [Paragonimus heterotremus]
AEVPSALVTLFDRISIPVCGSISGCKTYEDGVETLENVFAQPRNVIYARQVLVSCGQYSGENLDLFVCQLKLLAMVEEVGLLDGDQQFVAIVSVRHLTSKGEIPTTLISVTLQKLSTPLISLSPGVRT